MMPKLVAESSISTTGDADDDACGAETLEKRSAAFEATMKEKLAVCDAVYKVKGLAGKSAKAP